MAPFTIVLVRHGESEGNEQNILCGWYDAKLTEKGKQEARDAGKALKSAGFNFDIAYTSFLRRAQDTLQHILEEIGQSDLPVVKTWRLNERHYGGLTGLNKNDITEKLGEQQAFLLRRDFDTSISPMEPDHPYYKTVVEDCKYADEFIQEELPKFEILRSAMERALVFWNNTIVPQIRAGKRIIISSHEHTLRGIIQHLDQMTDDQIMPVSLYNAVPFVYTLDENLKPIKRLEFLGDPETVKKAMEAVNL